MFDHVFIAISALKRLFASARENFAQQCYSAHVQFIARGSKAWRKKQLPLDWGEFLFPIMLRTAAQFRSSIKDNLAQAALKTERIDAPGIRGERRFLIRANGRDATKIKEGTLSEGFDHLRRWVVGQAEVRKGAK